MNPALTIFHFVFVGASETQTQSSCVPTQYRTLLIGDPLVFVIFVTILAYAVFSQSVYVFCTCIVFQARVIVPVVMISPYHFTIDPELNINPEVSIVGLYALFVSIVPLAFHVFVPSPSIPIALSRG